MPQITMVCCDNVVCLLYEHLLKDKMHIGMVQAVPNQIINI